MTCPVCAGIRVRAARVPSDRTLVECAGCGLLYEGTPAAGVVRRARMSDEERRFEERVAQRRTPHFVRLLHALGRPGRLLDVGTGVGELLRLAREAGWQAVGIEVDPAVVAYARHRGLDVRLGQLATLGLSAASFDVVTLWNVLDVVPDPLAELGECRRLLAPDGRIFIRVPNAPVQRAAMRLTHTASALRLGGGLAGRPRVLGVFHRFNFGARTLRIVLERAGFQDVDVRNSAPIGGDPYLGLGRAGERVLDVGKRVLAGAAGLAALGTGGRWLLGPSIEAWARRPA
jgi:SAM-dependent methyltransferase